MSSSAQDSAFRQLLGAFALLALVLLALRVGLVLTPLGAATTPDSLNYLEMASGIYQGQGASIPSVGLESAPRTVVSLWAPLYPAWIAAFLPLAAPVVAAAALANGAALVALALIFQRICRRWTRDLAASACAAVLVVMPSMQLDYSYAWSETLCLPLLMACYLALLDYTRVARAESWRAGVGWLLGAAAACALCIYTRYASVAFIPLVLGSIAWLTPQLSWRTRLLHVMLAGVAIATLIAPLLVRNLQLSGHLSGGDRAQTLIPPDAYIQGLVDSLRFYVFADRSWILLVLLVVYAALAWRGRQRAAPSAEAPVRADSAWLPLAWAMLYLLGLIVMSRLQHIDNDSRMTSLAVPFLMLTTICISHAQARRWGRLAWLPLTGIMALWALTGAASVARVTLAWPQHGAPDFALIDNPAQVFNNFTRRPDDPGQAALKWAVQALNADGSGQLIFSDINPLVLNFMTGAHVRWLPNPLRADTIQRINGLATNRGALLITRSESLNALKALYGERLAGLRAIDVGRPIDAVLIALPLPLPMERVKGIEPSS